MMVLTLLTKQVDGEFTVYWKTGLRRGGELKVDLGEQYDKLPEQQKPIAAELYAIHHLLSVKEVMGSNRSGNGLQIRVSKGAIKKLQKQRSTQHSLYSLTRFLLTRYQEAQISVEKRDDWLSRSFEEYSVAYSRPRLPLIPDEACHPFHAKAATDSTAKLPPWQAA